MSSSKTYTKKDLINKVAYKLNMNYEESKIITDCVLDSFEEFFINTSGKNRVEIRNFGIFNVLLMKERTNARNPRTAFPDISYLYECKKSKNSKN